MKSPGNASTCASLLLASTLVAGVALAEERVFSAKGYAKNGGALLFVEEHREQWDGERLLRMETTYLRGDKILAHQSLDFRSGRFTPSSRLDNLVTGGSLVVRVKDAGRVIEMERKSDRDAERERETVSPPGRVVTPGGLQLLIVEHWTEIEAGTAVDFSMVVPSRLAWYSLRVRKVRTLREQGRTLIVVALTPANAALRLIAPTTEFFFDSQTRALRRYEGQLTVTDADGDRLEGRVPFDQSPLDPPRSPRDG